MANCLITGCVLHNRDTKESWRGDLHEVSNAYVVNVNEQSRTVGDVNDEDKVVWFNCDCDLFTRRGVYVMPKLEIDETWGLNDTARDYISGQ